MMVGTNSYAPSASQIVSEELRYSATDFLDKNLLYHFLSN